MPSRDWRHKTTDAGPKVWKLPTRDSGKCAQPAGMPAVLTHLEITPWRPDWLAGAPGFEPGNGGIKIRCLTTWLRPKTPRCLSRARYSGEMRHDQCGPVWTYADQGDLAAYVIMARTRGRSPRSSP